MEKIELKVGDRVRIVNERQASQGYFEQHGCKIGDIIIVEEVVKSTGGYGIIYGKMNGESERVGFFNSEVTIMPTNPYNCKYSCNPCEGKCPFYEEG
jgi:hypothetical protein